MFVNFGNIVVGFNIIQMKEKDKEKKVEGETNIQVAIRVRPLNSKEIGQGESDIIRAQDNLIVEMALCRLSWIQWRPSTRCRIKRCWMCYTDRKNSVMLLIRFIGINLQRRSMRKL